MRSILADASVQGRHGVFSSLLNGKGDAIDRDWAKARDSQLVHS